MVVMIIGKVVMGKKPKRDICVIIVERNSKIGIPHNRTVKENLYAANVYTKIE